MFGQLHQLRRRDRVHGRGFTLTELLVVIGIIVLLSALAVPMILRAYRQGSKVRTKADLNTISIALNAYKQDFGDYPRVNQVESTGPVLNLGPAILGKALVGPYGDGLLPDGSADDPQDPPQQSMMTNIKAGQVVEEANVGWVALIDDADGSNYGDRLQWSIFDPKDGADGPGFRTRLIRTGTGVAQYKVEGKVYGPYLQAGNFKMIGTFLYDRDGSPILYFAGNTKANIRAVRGYVWQTSVTNPKSSMMYDANDAIRFFRRDTESTDANALKRVQAMLGDVSDGSTGASNGKIDTNEKPATEAPFILWTAGPDGQFGPLGPFTTADPNWPTKRDLERCDDITSFTP